MALELAKMSPEEMVVKIRRCTRCLLPVTFPGISFDEQGVCNYCRKYRPIEVKGEAALVKLLDQYRGKGPKYDCIVPISGGRDSAYVLHQMVTKYKMRVLALTVDSGAIMPEGYRNISRITEVLAVDHAWIKDEKQIRTAQENTRIKFRAWLKKPSINTIVPVLNAGDKRMNLRMYEFAKERGISLVMGGNNVGNSSFEQEHFKTGYMGIFPNERGFYSSSDKLRLSLKLGWEFLRNEHNYHWPVFREYLGGAWVYLFESLSRPEGVLPLGFYDYVYWRESDVVPTIKKELDWKGASDTTATWRIDDSAYPLIDYLYYSIVGFNEFDEYYSKLIREGQLIRDEGLHRCLSDNRPRVPSIERSFAELGVTKAQVDEAAKKCRLKMLKKTPSENVT